MGIIEAPNEEVGFMELVWTIGRQILTMFLYIAVGFALYRAGLVDREGSKSLANLLLYVILPSVIVNSFQVERTPEAVREVGISLLLGGGALVLSMVVAALLMGKHPLDNFSAAFSNAGFMGFPLVTAVLGSGATFYAAGFVALLNALQWTYGQWVLTGDRREISPKRVAKNPIVLALLAGLLLFFAGLPLPGVVKGAMSTLAGANAPVAMVILGVYLAQTDLKAMLVKPRLYLVSLLRLVGIPLLTLGLLWLVGGNYPRMAMALTLVAAAPVGSNVAVYAQKLDQDYTYAVELVCISTLLSIFTMPALAAVVQRLF